ncbi:MAG: NAD(+) diphosphatase [Tabrizicola sp.]|nr:NAD(+) diphosphatase [Tabrizicola sp.]
MRQAETVTFGGSGLDRAAQLRRDSEALTLALGQGQVLALWRGKPLARGDRLVWLPSDHPALENVAPPVFLGMDDAIPRFAADLSSWEPGPGMEQDPNGFSDPSVQRHPAVGDDAGFVELRGIMARLTLREAELVATGKAILGWHQSHGFCAACGARSDIVQGGWQRSCPSCKAQHFPRTDPVVIMLVTHGNAVLLGRSGGWPEGMFSLLAGFIEPGETVEAAVRREVFEESGVRCGDVEYLASQPWPFPASLMIAARTEAEAREITIDPVELEAARWVTREDLVTILAGRHFEIRPFRKGAIAEFILRNWLADRLD